MKIKYTSSVFTPSGWRGVEITAIAERNSEKMATVTTVTEIDGESPKLGMSRTGARRQEYNGAGVGCREVGMRKRLSSCEILVD